MTVIMVPAIMTVMTAAALLVKLNLFMFIIGFPVLYATGEALIRRSKNALSRLLPTSDPV